MRLAITGADGKEHIVDFDTQPSDADIDEVAASFAPARRPMPAPLGGGFKPLQVQGPIAVRPVAQPAVNPALVGAMMGGGAQMPAQRQQKANVQQAVNTANAFLQMGKPDPWASLPFTQADFQQAINAGTVVRGRNGKPIELDAAVRAYRKAFGKDPAMTMSQSQVEQDQVLQVGQTSGRFNKGQTDKQVARGNNQLYDKQFDPKTGERNTRSKVARDTANKSQESVSDYLKKAGLNPTVSDILGGIVTAPLHTLAEANTLQDTGEDIKTVAGAAQNLLLEGAGGAVAEAAITALKPSFKALGQLATKGGAKGVERLKSFRKAVETGDQASAKKAVIELGVEETQAEKIVANTFDAQGKPARVETQRPKPQSVKDQQPKPVQSEPSAVAQKQSAGDVLQTRPEVGGEIPPRTAKPNEATGLSVAQRTKESEALGTAKPQPVKQPTLREAHASGKAKVDSGETDPYTLVKDLASKKRAATPEEYGAIQEGRRRLIQDINRTRKELDDAIAKGEDASTKQQAYAQALERSGAFDADLDQVKGASGGSLNALKIGSTIDEGDFAQVVAEVRRKKGSALTPKEEGKVKALTAQVETLQRQLDEATATQNNASVQRVLGSVKRKGGSIEEIRARRTDAKARLAEKNKQFTKELVGQANDVLGVGFSFAKHAANIAPEVMEIVASHLEEGVVRAADLIGKVRDDMKEVGIELSDQEVGDIIEGRYPKPERPKTPAQIRLQRVRDELRSNRQLQAKIVRDAKTADTREKREALRKASKEYRDNKARLAKEERQARRAELEETFGAQSRIERGFERLNEVGPPKPPPSREVPPHLQKLKDQLDLRKKQIRQEIANAQPQTVGEKARSLQRAARLSNPMSRVFDVLSNAVTYTDRQAAKPLESVVDRVLFPKSDRVSPGWSFDRARSVAKGAGARWKKGFTEQMTVGDPALMLKIGATDIRTKNEAVNTVVNKISRFAGVTDIPFKDSVYEGALRELAETRARADLGKGATKDAVSKLRESIVRQAKDGEAYEDINALANNEAIEALFGADSQGAQLITDLQNAVKRRAGPWAQFAVDLIVPFPRIFANISGYTTDYVYGLAKAAGRFNKARQAGEGFSIAQRREINRLAARNLRGLALMAMGYYAYENGLIKGDVNEKAAFIDWGDLDQLSGPVGSIVLLGATYAAANKTSDPALLRRKAAIDLFANQPAISGPVRFFTTLPKDPGKATGQAATGLIPGIIREWARRQDEWKNGVKRRKTEGFVDTISSAVPGLRETLPPAG